LSKDGNSRSVRFQKGQNLGIRGDLLKGGGMVAGRASTGGKKAMQMLADVNAIKTDRGSHQRASKGV